MSYLWLCLLGILAEAVFIVMERKKRYLPTVIWKAAASAIFVVLGVLGLLLAADKSFAKWIVAGLVMGLVGDLCLNLRYVFTKRAKAIFMLGIAAGRRAPRAQSFTVLCRPAFERVELTAFLAFSKIF